ncbi:MAG: endonuclease III [Oscillospiraceae bacterium]
MTKKERALLVVKRLEKAYPNAVCSLTYTHPYELLIATRLSAQCTDARVNLVTPVLFREYPSLQALAGANIADIEDIVRTCGLFHTKARDIVMMSRMLLEVYEGELPDTLEELIKLPGIGRKTANLIMGDIYHQPAVVTDTHVIRICGRLGLTTETDPFLVEMALKKILPPEESNDFCHRMVHFGREFCKARAPQCVVCPLQGVCRSMEKKA